MEQIIELKEELKKVRTTMDDIHYALIGNPITKDGGLVYRVIEGEVKIQRLSDRIDEVDERQTKKIVDLEKDKEKMNTYIGIIWGCGGALVSAIAIATINHFIK